MHTQFVTNGEIKLIISPENEHEKQLLKALLKQDNDFIEYRTPVTVIDKTFTDSVVIGKRIPASSRDNSLSDVDQA